MIRALLVALMLVVSQAAPASEFILNRSPDSTEQERILGYFVWYGASNQSVFYDNDKTYDADDCLSMWLNSTSTAMLGKANCATAPASTSLTFPRDVVVTRFSVFNSLAMQYGLSFGACKIRLHIYEATGGTYTQLAEYIRASSSGSSDTTLGQTDTQSLNALLPAGQMLQLASSDAANDSCPVPSAGVCVCFGQFGSVVTIMGYEK